MAKTYTQRFRDFEAEFVARGTDPQAMPVFEVVDGEERPLRRPPSPAACASCPTPRRSAISSSRTESRTRWIRIEPSRSGEAESVARTRLLLRKCAGRRPGNFVTRRRAPARAGPSRPPVPHPFTRDGPRSRCAVKRAALTLSVPRCVQSRSDQRLLTVPKRQSAIAAPKTLPAADEGRSAHPANASRYR